MTNPFRETTVAIAAIAAVATLSLLFGTPAWAATDMEIEQKNIHKKLKKTLCICQEVGNESVPGTVFSYYDGGVQKLKLGCELRFYAFDGTDAGFFNCDDFITVP